MRVPRLDGAPFKEFVRRLRRHRADGRATSTRPCASAGIFGGLDLTAATARARAERAATASPRCTRRPTSTGSSPRRWRGGAWHERAPRRGVPPGALGRADRLRAGDARASAASSRRRSRRRRRARPATPLGRLPAGAAPHDPAGAAGAGPAARAAPLPAAVAGDAGRGRRHRPRPRHLHDEVQPAGQRGADPRAAGRRPAPAARTTTPCRGCWRSCTASSGCSARSRAWTASASSPAAARQAVYANARIIRAYHAARGRGRAAQRDHHDGLLAPVRRRGARRRRASSVVTLYPGADGLPRPRRAQGGALGAHRGPDDHQPRGHRDLQPATSTASSTSCTRRAASAPTTRPTPTASSASPAPATPASTSASSTCTRRSRRRTAPMGMPVRRRRA